MSATKGSRRKQRGVDLEDLSGDEVDAFHAARDMVPLNLADGDGDDDDALSGEEEVLGLAAEEAQEEKEEEEEEEEDTEQISWGRKREAYYEQVNHDREQTAEAAELEEEEARRLQRHRAAALADEDFAGVSAASQAEERSTEGALVSAMDRELESVTLSGTPGTAVVEHVERDVSALSREEKLRIVAQDSPELVGLLADFRDKLRALRNELEPLLARVRKGELPTSRGVSFLELKYHLLLQYCTNAAFYLVLKAEGHPVRDHPVIEELVRLRVIIEKLRPVEKKLRYQLDKLLKSAVSDATAPSSDPLRFRPNIRDLGSDGEEEGEEGKGSGEEDATAATGVYRPPRLREVHYDEDGKRGRMRAKGAAAAAAAAAPSSLAQSSMSPSPVDLPSSVRAIPGSAGAAATATTAVSSSPSSPASFTSSGSAPEQAQPLPPSKSSKDSGASPTDVRAQEPEVSVEETRVRATRASFAPKPEQPLVGAAEQQTSPASSPAAEQLESEQQAVGERKHVDEDSTLPRWRSHRKHVFMLSIAGKPIYSRYGDEQKLAPFMASLMALVSFVADTNDQLRYFVAGKRTVVFLIRGPVYLVGVCGTGESRQAVARQLFHVHAQVASILTASSIAKIFAKRPDFDLRGLLVGTDRVVDNLIHHMNHSASIMLNAVHPLPLPANVRANVEAALAAAACPELLFAVLISGFSLVHMARPRRFTLDPVDLHILMNFVNSSTSFRTNRSWTPLCLPMFDDKVYYPQHFFIFPFLFFLSHLFAFIIGIFACVHLLFDT